MITHLMFPFPKFQFNRSLLTSYYVATLISYFVFRLMQETIIYWTRWLISFVKAVLGITIQSDTGLWLSLFAVCSFITAIIYYILYTLDIYSNDNDNQIWDDILLFFIIIGLNVYLMNQVFVNQPMPRQLPSFAIHLLGGYQNTFGNNSVISSEDKTAWSIVPWIWTLGPLIFMFLRKMALKMKKNNLA